ncbi:MAG: glutaminase A [Alphaproteobacteria bacterium]|nr:glutaminase A [Alphaproteobacteria bacterium]
METVPDIQSTIDEACDRARKAIGGGKVADYIPELAGADPAKVGIAVQTVDGQEYVAGDDDVPFTLQSISKVFALAALMRTEGLTALNGMPCEPSGDAFHSIVRLEEEKGHPRNPLINAGAILVTSRLPGDDPGEKLESVRDFLTLCLGDEIAIDENVYRSERGTGYRNRALANYMQHFGLLEDAENACDAYFRQCALAMSARQLARAGLFLAAQGKDPLSGRDVLSAPCARVVLALMTTCGLYDEVGRFALAVGLPAKSGVSGGILAVVPGSMAIATYGPALGPKGNSIAGMEMLRHLSEALDLSLFG